MPLISNKDAFYFEKLRFTPPFPAQFETPAVVCLSIFTLVRWRSWGVLKSFWRASLPLARSVSAQEAPSTGHIRQSSQTHNRSCSTQVWYTQTHTHMHIHKHRLQVPWLFTDAWVYVSGLVLICAFQTVCWCGGELHSTKCQGCLFILFCFGPKT